MDIKYTNNITAEDYNYLRKSVEWPELKSVVLMAVSDISGLIVAFAQLYPVFSTVSLKKQWLLSDFYVEETERNKGVGSALMDAVKEHFRGDSKGFILVTAKKNAAAKYFYDRHGWKTNEYDFYTYFYG